MNKQQFVDEALTHIESESIRQWVNTENNRPIIEKMAENTLAKNKDADPLRFGTYLTCLAMGM